MSSSLSTKIEYRGSGERIDTRLSYQFPYSRNFFHHIISRGGIKIGEKKIKKSYKLKNGDKIQIDNLKRYLSPIVLEEAPNIKIPIILEKEDYMIINKPKGVLSHPNSVWDVNQPSVVGFLYHNFKGLPSIGNFIRAGLIHRLDKDTDGLMIIAKTEKGLAHFKSLFQQKSNIVPLNKGDEGGSKNIKETNIPIRKFYKATSIITVLGEEFLKKIKDNLPYYIQETVHAKVPNPTPKMGITKILNCKTIPLCEGKKGGGIELKLEILTGRTHQIRYHLSNHGLPILGDYLYGNEDENHKMQLTAYKLEFTDPNGEKINLKI
ncbi:MAG TPA: RluA family pseudouridine synthase [Candidatus Absconditabacterales bacterium]|nr:RluA family pseudouridine synthase [Candidatus Absconditabacterales bacterium]